MSIPFPYSEITDVRRSPSGEGFIYIIDGKLQAVLLHETVAPSSGLNTARSVASTTRPVNRAIPVGVAADTRRLNQPFVGQAAIPINHATGANGFGAYPVGYGAVPQNFAAIPAGVLALPAGELNPVRICE